MTDYIDRQAAIDAIPEVEADIFENCGRCELLTKEDVVEILQGLPSAEAELVMRGRWLAHPSAREYDVCSACGCDVKRRQYGVLDGKEWVQEFGYQFCPWCGAKMEVSDNG